MARILREALLHRRKSCYGIGLRQVIRYNAPPQSKAPVAHLDRVLGYEPRGREFESLRAHQEF